MTSEPTMFERVAFICHKLRAAHLSMGDHEAKGLEITLHPDAFRELVRTAPSHFTWGPLPTDGNYVTVQGVKVREVHPR